MAAPNVRDPERVVIRNPANGAEVIGALFKREREMAGPDLQLSSEAALALGVLAGAPTELEVVALRREEAPADVTSSAERRVDALEDVPPQGVAVTESEEATLAESDLPMIVPAEMPRRQGGFFARIFGRGRAPTGTATTEASLPATPEGSFVTEGATIPAIAQDAPAPESAPAAPISSTYIQVATFKSKQNAEAAGERVSAAGLSSRVVSQVSNGEQFWRILVGPVADRANGAEIIRKVGDLGFGDAFVVDG
ncbi:SPOR domain-containing protein [Jannaschia seosinensis]|uniref:SPOR domain-containing protein n=1 Tax=Jannaschia seosinensis TaxID=313367 RepID=UPI001C8FFB42|nr:SPOR domain-containing protein [Jannaschia seosinensis]